jgi:hypothetical protein
MTSKGKGYANPSMIVAGSKPYVSNLESINSMCVRIVEDQRTVSVKTTGVYAVGPILDGTPAVVREATDDEILHTLVSISVWDRWTDIRIMPSGCASE